MPPDGSRLLDFLKKAQSAENQRPEKYTGRGHIRLLHRCLRGWRELGPAQRTAAASSACAIPAANPEARAAAFATIAAAAAMFLAVPVGCFSRNSNRPRPSFANSQTQTWSASSFHRPSAVVCLRAAVCDDCEKLCRAKRAGRDLPAVNGGDPDGVRGVCLT